MLKPLFFIVTSLAITGCIPEKIEEINNFDCNSEYVKNILTNHYKEKLIELVVNGNTISYQSLVQTKVRNTDDFIRQVKGLKYEVKRVLVSHKTDNTLNCRADLATYYKGEGYFIPIEYNIKRYLDSKNSNPSVFATNVNSQTLFQLMRPLYKQSL